MTSRGAPGEVPIAQERLPAIVADGLLRRRRRRRRRRTAAMAVVVVAVALTTRVVDVGATDPVSVGTAAPMTSPSRLDMAREVAGELLAALTAEDWAAARRLAPGLGSDTELEQRFGPAERLAAVPVDTAVSGDVVALRLATVAHVVIGEPPDRFTWVECLTWDVDVVERTVRPGNESEANVHHVFGLTGRSWPLYRGWLRPETLAFEARSNCR